MPSGRKGQTLNRSTVVTRVTCEQNAEPHWKCGTDQFIGIPVVLTVITPVEAVISEPTEDGHVAVLGAKKRMPVIDRGPRQTICNQWDVGSVRIAVGDVQVVTRKVAFMKERTVGGRARARERCSIGRHDSRFTVRKCHDSQWSPRKYMRVRSIMAWTRATNSRKQ